MLARRFIDQLFERSASMLFSRKLMREFPQLEDLEVSDLSGHLYLNKLVVKPKFRGQGIGKIVVRRVQDYAKMRGLALALVPHPLAPGTEKRKLVGFYRGLGFKRTQGPLSFHNKADTFVSENSPSPIGDKGTKKSDLINFYRGAGFKGNKALARSHGDGSTLVSESLTNYWVVLADRDNVGRMHQSASKHGATFLGGDHQYGFNFKFDDEKSRRAFAASVREIAKRAGDVDV